MSFSVSVGEVQGCKGEKLVEVTVFINAFFSARDASVASLTVIFDVIQRECQSVEILTMCLVSARNGRGSNLVMSLVIIV